jgi:hypothetical protein
VTLTLSAATAKHRTESELPIIALPAADNDPVRKPRTPRIDSEEAMVIAPTMLAFCSEPQFNKPATDKPLPILMKVRSERDDAKHMPP